MVQILFSLAFNGDLGTNYGWVTVGGDSGATNLINGSDFGATKIQLNGATLTTGTGGGIQGSLYIQQLGTSSQRYQVWGQCMYKNSSGHYQVDSLSGEWFASANISSFVLRTVSGHNMTGVIDLYQVLGG